jgi:hypothetical protein
MSTYQKPVRILTTETNLPDEVQYLKFKVRSQMVAGLISTAGSVETLVLIV